MYGASHLRLVHSYLGRYSSQTYKAKLLANGGTEPWPNVGCKDTGNRGTNCSVLIKNHACDDPKWGSNTRKHCPLNCVQGTQPAIGPGSFNPTPRGSSRDGLTRALYFNKTCYLLSLLLC